MRPVFLNFFTFFRMRMRPVWLQLKGGWWPSLLWPLRCGARWRRAPRGSPWSTSLSSSGQLSFKSYLASSSLVSGWTKGPAQGTTIKRSSASRAGPKGIELMSPTQMFVSAETSSDPCEILPLWQKEESLERANSWRFGGGGRERWIQPGSFLLLLVSAILSNSWFQLWTLCQKKSILRS